MSNHLYARFKQTKNYRIEIKRGRKWEDAGDVYEEQSKTMCQKQMNSVNFFGHKVRMVMFVNTWKFDGVVEEKDFSK